MVPLSFQHDPTGLAVGRLQFGDCHDPTDRMRQGSKPLAAKTEGLGSREPGLRRPTYLVVHD